MPNSAAFLAKVAEKPKWMTAQEKAKTFAGPGGWYMKNGNPAAAPELIETIPGLSSMIDYDSAGVLTAAATVMTISDFSFARRSRRGFNLIVSFQEQIKNTSGSPLDFQLNFDPGSIVLDSNGAADGNWNPLTPALASVADDETFGRLVFQLPLLTEAPSQMMIKLSGPTPPITFPVVPPQPWDPATYGGTEFFVDTEGNVMLTLNQDLLITDPASGATGAELTIVG
jgi:hypothetical protein